MQPAVCSSGPAHPGPTTSAGAVGTMSMVGWSHRTCRLALLEQVALSAGARRRLLCALRASGGTDVVVIGTCSRTEVYAAGPGAPAPDELLAAVLDQVGGAVGELAAAAQARRGPAVVEHLFQVTAGLDSRVVGEGEVRAQVRRALKEAQAAGLGLPVLGPLVAAAVGCAGRIHERTGLSTHARSLGRRAVDVGLAGVGDVRDLDVLVVGSGEMARTAVEHLHALGARPRVSARDGSRAAQLVGQALVCPLPALVRGVAEADLLICATSAAHDVVTLDHVHQAMAGRRRPLTVVDLSVPRNVDARVGRVPGVRLVDVDSMSDGPTSDAALLSALAAAREMARVEAAGCVDRLSGRAAAPVIVSLRRHVEDLCLRELSRITAGQVEQDLLERAARAITGKLMHQPTVAARAAAAAGDAAVLQLLCELFDAVPAEPW